MPVQCKRCGSGVADTAEVCGVCNTPINAVIEDAAPAPGALKAGIPGLPIAQPQQPAANYLTGGPASVTGGETRVSLTGDVIEVAQPTPRGTGPGGYGPPVGGRPGGPPAPGGAVRPGGPRPRYGIPAASEEKSGGIPVWAFILILLVLGGAGIGGFMWWQKSQAPKAAAEKVGKLLAAKDLAGLYDMTYIPPDVEAKAKALMGTSDLRKSYSDMQNSPFMSMIQINDVKMGDMVVDGDKASGKFSFTIVAGGQTQTKDNQDIKLRLVDGKWKIDGSDSAGALGSVGGGFGGGAPK